MTHRPLKTPVIDGVWCNPGTSELIARTSDHWRAKATYGRSDDDDPAWTLFIDCLPEVKAIEEHCDRRLYRTPDGRFFVWAYWVTIRATDNREIERDEFALLSRDRAWRWMREPDVTILISLQRFPSRKQPK